MMIKMEEIGALSDNELMARVQNGDTDAYEILINKYQGRLINYAYGILKIWKRQRTLCRTHLYVHIEKLVISVPMEILPVGSIG